MANKSALRRVKQDLRKKMANRHKKHTMQTFIKRAIANCNDTDVQLAQSYISNCIKHGIIHRNTGARRMSQMMLKTNAQQSQSTTSNKQ